MQMRFHLRGFAERRRIVVIVNNSRWCRSDSEQTHKFLPLDCDTRGRNLCVCAEPRWRKELKCQSLKTKPREVRALNLLRTFSERESEQWWRGNHLHSKHFLSSGVIKEDGDEWNPLLLLLLISTFSDLPLALRPASLILNVSPIRTNSWWMRARVCNTQSEAIVFN